MVQLLLPLIWALIIMGVMGWLFYEFVFVRWWQFNRKRKRTEYAKYHPRNMWRRARGRPVYEVRLPTVRDFVLTLQLSLSLAETLAGALQQASLQFGDRGVFGQRLVTRVKSQLQVEPEAVIAALAKDFESEDLVNLAERLEMAHEGGLAYSEAVNVTLDDIEEKIRINVEKEIERAPVMLTIPMIIGVFFSALSLLGFPLLVVMFQTMTGTTN